MDICSSMFVRKKNIPPRNRGGMQQILRCRGVPRCGACATRRDKKNPRSGDRSGGAESDLTMG